MPSDGWFCGLQLPSVSALPISDSAPLPLTVVVPPSLPIAMAVGAATADRPSRDTATAAPAIIFFINFTFRSVPLWNVLINCHHP